MMFVPTSTTEAPLEVWTYIQELHFMTVFC